MKSPLCSLIAFACLLCTPIALVAQEAPPFDTRFPSAPPPPQVRPPTASPAPGALTPAQAHTQVTPNFGPLASGVLAFDAEQKEYITKPGEYVADYVFLLTNISPAELTIYRVHTSCGCTTTKLPPMPWKLPPGGSGEIPVHMNLAGKSGVVFKTVTLQTDKGQKPLGVKATITAMDPNLMSAADRERNQLLAKADRQAVFKGDCARCHVEPVIGKVSKDLYTTACGICHEAEHRATMVPDLRNLPNDTNADYWRLMITLGKPNTLMPAFAQAQGGPLSDMQVNSLVQYLAATMPAQGTNSRPRLSQPAAGNHPAGGH
jgi:mono/diheme cytochrome c family protein